MSTPVAAVNLKVDAHLDRPNNGYIDPKIDYQKFYGRVSDRKDRVLKIAVENNNTKFLKAGDIVYFRVNNHDTKLPCKASVKNIEDRYFTIYVSQFKYCWDENKYFTRGMQLNLESKVMQERVFEASKFREQLILRKEGFLSQLSSINNFLWSFNQQKIKLAAEYDEEINELRKQKRLALDALVEKKEENIMLQVVLQKKLTTLDDSLDHYKIDRREYLTDRWKRDHDLGMNYLNRPVELKRKEKSKIDLDI